MLLDAQRTLLIWWCPDPDSTGDWEQPVVCSTHSSQGLAVDARQTPIVVFEEFLGSAELERVHVYAQARERDFVQSQCVGKDMGGVYDPEHRRSRVLYDLGGLHDLLGRRIMHVLPLVCYRLGIEPVPITLLELQLTASNDGEFFRAHKDNTNGKVGGRWITFVYFCYREPRAFTGGTLRIYGRDPATGVDLMDLGWVIEPMQNSVVFFASNRLHEIAPIGCPSRSFADSRLTLNGWLHQ
jgi:SM-20-related protein